MLQDAVLMSRRLPLQSEHQSGSSTFAAFLVETQLDTGSVRGVLAGALLASIGIGLVVYSILGTLSALRRIVASAA